MRPSVRRPAQRRDDALHPHEARALDEHGRVGCDYLRDVLGDMGEVGAGGPAFHREVGDYARTARIERLLGVGTLTLQSVAAFGAGSEHFASVEDLATHLADSAPPGATILVKGSRVMRMERVIAALTGDARAGAH